MSQTVTKKISESKGARWAALIIVSFTMMWGYFLTDALSPLMTMLEEQMGWTSLEFGQFNWAYCWFNVFLFMLIFGGIILDKMGVRFTGIVTCILMFAGALIKYYAVTQISSGPEAGTVFGMRTQVFVACLGYAIFAVGTENCGITVSKVITKWFAGKELALAMGVQVAVARLGTAAALVFCPMIAKHFSVSAPLLLSAILLCIGFLAYLVFCGMDKKFDAEVAQAQTEPDDVFKVKDLKLIITNRGFWLIALLCLMFYSAVFPFMKYAASLMENKYGVSTTLAGLIPSLIPFGNLIMTPLFGGIYDKKGKGATIMIIGSLLLILVHVLFALPLLNYWWFAAFIMIILGIAFSLVPSAMWPSVPKIIPQKLVGSAYALIFWVQNIGLGFVPLLIGGILDKYCKVGTRLVEGAEVTQYNYTLPMIIFALFGIVALLLALRLKAVDKKEGYGLEEPNIKQ
ncbi:MAG: MFS transporter [Bacteroidaceae bacterium]|jgi:nitrate/nitrite transporter NarK|nr:MFS transporter [Bacteroidaceae bacterium]MBR6856039.1 MFS transporter [Bacteroidaceae bacterium]